jgi:hypothetical protein
MPRQRAGALKPDWRIALNAVENDRRATNHHVPTSLTAKVAYGDNRERQNFKRRTAHAQDCEPRMINRQERQERQESQ